MGTCSLHTRGRRSAWLVGVGPRLVYVTPAGESATKLDRLMHPFIRSFRVGLAVVLFAAITAGIPASAWSQASPDFSGNWTLDLENSDFGGMMAIARTDRIQQTAEQLKVTRTLNGPDGPITGTVTYGFDGAEYANTFGPLSQKSRLRWEGAVLVISTTSTGPQGEVSSVDKLSLSQDGKVLTMERVLSFQGQEMPSKLIFKRA